MEIVKFLKIFENNPYINILLYDTNILYTNNTLLQILEIPPQLIKKLKPYDIALLKEDREKLKAIINQIHNEELLKTNTPILLRTSSHKRIYMEFYAQNLHQEKGLLIGINVTNDVKKEYLLNILKNINQTIIKSENMIELFSNLTEAIFNNNTYEFVCNFQFNEEKKRFELNEHTGEIYKNAVNSIIKIINSDSISEVLQNKLLTINTSLFKDIYSYYKSLLFIPIQKNNQIISIITICSKFNNDFEELEIKLFEEAKKEIEFGIEKIKNLSFLILLQEALKKTFGWVIITDEEGNILYANKSVEEISGYSIKELLGKNPKIFKSNLHDKYFYEKLWENLKNNKIFEGIIINKNKKGELFYLKNRIIPISTPNQKNYYISLAIDITKETKLKNKIQYLSVKDSVTNLYSRSGFIKKVKESIQKDKKYALLVIDIKDFKILNQLSGIEAGDFLLKKFAELLTHVFYDNDIIGRIGGDEFAVFLEYHSLKELEFIVHKLINKTKHIEFFNTHLSINIGIALYPKDSTDINELLEKASLALDIAKTQGDYAYEYFNIEIHNEIKKYSDIKKMLTEALKEKKFVYYFQPYVDAKTLKIAGAETLLRIKSSQLITPNHFIDYAENSGFIKKIEEQMVPILAKQAKEINIPLSFNISGNSLKDKKHIQKILSYIKDLPLTIELTEREIAINIEYTKEIINMFKSNNLKISIDDFGTGYSSLVYLKDLPADYIKIDISFIRNIEHSKKDLAIVETIINFAHKFDIKTIAEGIETQNQVKILQELECDYLQGFFFAKPMTFENLKNFLKNS